MSDAAAARQGGQGDPQAPEGGQGRDLRLPAQIPRRPEHNPGLQFKQLKGNSRLYSARVNQEYRALLLQVGEADYILVAVKNRRDGLRKPRPVAYQHQPGHRWHRVHRPGRHRGAASRSSAPPSPSAAEAAGPPAPCSPPTRLTYLGLGVAEPLLALIAKITTEDELLGLAEYAPQLTTEVLLALHDGKSADEVLDQVTTPVPRPTTGRRGRLRGGPGQARDPGHHRRHGPAGGLEEDFGRWHVFLHPTQRRMVERDYNGPARVSGGPGTGKTIVALHRVRAPGGPAADPGTTRRPVHHVQQEPGSRPEEATA